MSRSDLRVMLIALGIAMACPVAHGANINDFSVFSLTSGGATLLPGRLYVPPEASTGARPLIVFLHGAGESGANNAAQVNGNINNLLAEAKRRGAYLYAPQTNSGWNGLTTTDRVMSMVDRALAEQNVDATRLYVTGLSMGGGGAWNMMSRYGARIAAGVPICAVGPSGDFSLTGMLAEPTWAFHARNDSTVNVASSRNVINNILGAAGETPPTYPTSGRIDFSFTSTSLDLNYTEYYTGGHGIWGRVYNTPAMYDWLFARTTANVPEPSGFALLLVSVVATRFVAGRSERRPRGGFLTAIRGRLFTLRQVA